MIFISFVEFIEAEKKDSSKPSSDFKKKVRFIFFFLELLSFAFLTSFCICLLGRAYGERCIL